MKQTELPAENAARLLSVIKGDWSPYARPMTCAGLVASDGSGSVVAQPPIELITYDWELLRHDIHVAFHRTGTVIH